jgi:hypothetical protein
MVSLSQPARMNLIHVYSIVLDKYTEGATFFSTCTVCASFGR